MKSIILFFLIALSIVAKALSPDALVLDANKAYTASDFKKAVLLYEQVLKEKKFESTILYYNLGNAYFKLTDFPNAILNYHRALRLNPDDDDVLNNLNLANAKIQDRIEPIPELFYIRWANKLRNSVSVDTWALFFLLFFALSAVGWVFYIVGKSISTRKTGFYLGIIMLFFSIFTFGMSWSAQHYQNTVKEAVVFSGSVSVKSSPAESGTSLFVVHAGTFVIITDQVGEWVKVRIPDGNEGWILMADLEVI
jgi:tetratricopeptide (TPR) repeat protein